MGGWVGWKKEKKPSCWLRKCAESAKWRTVATLRVQEAWWRREDKIGREGHRSAKIKGGVHLLPHCLNCSDHAKAPVISDTTSNDKESEWLAVLGTPSPFPSEPCIQQAVPNCSLWVAETAAKGDRDSRTAQWLWWILLGLPRVSYGSMDQSILFFFSHFFIGPVGKTTISVHLSLHKALTLTSDPCLCLLYSRLPSISLATFP